MWYWLRRRAHPTWHFTTVCCGVVLGVVAARWCDAFWQTGWIAVGLVLAGAALYKQWRILLVASLLAGVCIGLWRGSVERVSATMYDGVYGKHVRLTGRVESDVELGVRGQTAVRMGALRDETGRRQAGVMRITTSDKRAIKRGDSVTADGELERGFGTFVATMNNARILEVARAGDGDPALVARDAFSGAIKRTVEDPAASLGTGYLLGQKQALPQALQEALVVTGLTHVVVASGYNLTILVRLARRLFARLSKYLAALVSVSLVVGFIAISGLSPSMTRAGLVSLLGIWAWYVGRTFHPVTLLALAASATILWNPYYAWGDIGWLLSFGAFAGVMIVAPLLRAYFYGEQKPTVIGQILGETVAAQLMTAPIILLVFGQFSNVALFSNLLIVPFIPLAMLLVFVAGVGGFIAPIMPIVGMALGWPARVLLDGMLAVVNWTAGIPWAQSSVAFSGAGVAIWYGAMAAICAYVAWRTKYRLREASVVE